VGWKGFTRKPELKVLMKLDPVWLKCGPYEVTEGIYPGQGQRKNWGWAREVMPLTIDEPLTYILF
jgi:hypothetical protein